MKNLLLIALTLISTFAFAQQLKPVAYSDGAQKLNGFVIAPKAGTSKGGVLVLPAWKGVDAHSKKAAQDLGKLGYHAFVADIYGQGNYPQDNKSAAAQSGHYKTNYQVYQHRIKVALEQLIKAGAAPNKLVVIGYCFGGTGALEAARANMAVQGVVSFHGGLKKDPSRAAKTIKPKVLVLHGADDPSVPEKEANAFHQEMRDSKADWQMIYYANAVHAFTEPAAGDDNSKGAAYNEKADKRSWQHLLTFLKEVL
jgi:dienelactone hydrolase